MSRSGLEDAALLSELSHPSPGTLRKSNSSPSLYTSCSDSPSPKEILSDTTVTQTSSSGSSVQRSCDSSDSDLTVREVKSVLMRKRSNSFHDPEKEKQATVVPVISKEQMLSSAGRVDDKSRKELSGRNIEKDVNTGVVKEVDSSKDNERQSRNEPEVKKSQKDSNADTIDMVEVVSPPAVVSPSAGLVSHTLEVVCENEGTDTLKVHTDPGLAATPDSSDGSWLQDEVPELPAVKKRGHTISVMSPAQVAQQQQAADAKNKRSMTKDQQGGINPSFVFLQLFHSHSHLLGHDQPPMLLPQTEVNVGKAIRLLVMS